MKFSKKILYILMILNICFCLTACDDIKNSNEYEMWHLNAMGIDELWTYSKGESQIVAIIDSGISDELGDKYKDSIILKHNIMVRVS